jgi:hypothetical protein
MSMIEVNKNWYENILAVLSNEIGKGSYFSGTINGSRDGIDWVLRTSVIIYHDDFNNIIEIVPVWWEFITGIHGKELDNNFSFSELNKLL